MLSYLQTKQTLNYKPIQIKCSHPNHTDKCAAPRSEKLEDNNIFYAFMFGYFKF